MHKTLNIKLITILTLVLTTTMPVLEAQEKSGFDLINKLKLEVRADGEYTTTDSTPNLGFHGKYFNLMLGGELGGGFSYYFKQRIVANEGTVTFFDNTDFLYLDYMPSQNWRFRFGKDAMALGGFEYDASPIDVYFPTRAGNMGHLHTLWSTSLVEYKWNHYLNMTMLGTKLVYDKWDLYLDLMHHALTTRDWGKNFGVVSCANYYFTDRFNIFVKGMYEQNKSSVHLASTVAADHQLAAGHTFARYGLGFEWYANKQKNVRLHIYGCQTIDSYTDDSDVRHTDDYWNFNIGATWTMDYFKMFKKN